MQTRFVDIPTGECGLEQSRQRYACALKMVSHIGREPVDRIEPADAESGRPRTGCEVMVDRLEVLLIGGFQDRPVIAAAPLRGAAEARGAAKVVGLWRPVEKTIARSAKRRREQPGLRWASSKSAVSTASLPSNTSGATGWLREQDASAAAPRPLLMKSRRFMPPTPPCHDPAR